jgi:predicted histone-like DNA-binding protein
MSFFFVSSKTTFAACCNDAAQLNFLIMILLKKIQRPNPLDATAAKKFYVTPQNGGEVTLETLSEIISDRCTLTDVDVLATLTALTKEMTTQLMVGKIVRLVNFGSFQLGISSQGVDAADEISRSQVKGVRVKFRPGKPIQERLTLVKFTVSQEPA